MLINIVISIITILIAIVELNKTIIDRYNDQIKKETPVILVRTRNPDILHNEGYANSKIEKGRFVFKFILNNSGENIAWIKSAYICALNKFEVINFDKNLITKLEEIPNLKVFAQKSYSTISHIFDIDDTRKIIEFNKSNNYVYIGLQIIYNGAIEDDFKTMSIVKLKKLKVKTDKYLPRQENI